MYVLPVSISLVGLSTIVVALRLYTRIRLVCSPGWDDWFLLLSLLTDYAFFGVLMAEHTHGLGKPQATLTQSEYQNQLKMLWISVPLYNLTLNLTKISMVLLYLRLFTTRVYRVLLWVLLVLIVCSGLWMVIGTLLICIPVQAFWDPSMPHTCISREVVWFLNAALQIAGDLILVILPMPQLVRLRIPRRQKVCVMFIFALGLFVCATSAVRLHTLVLLTRATDYSRLNGIVAIWSFAECNVAIVCASLPTFRQLIYQKFPWSLPSCARASRSQGEKRLRDPAMLWEPFHGNAGYSADVSVDVGMDSNSHCHSGASGIQVVRELRWEMGSAPTRCEGEDEPRPLSGKAEQPDFDRMPDLQFQV
ncbi:hypothetical protein ASPCAL10549 [Aspergillus calidoustus]|uniref:Rhodopsin domain-containing protein n=1 Tax=Aspergillus calidoustus TaxID=454130 RepID=A0A0U5G6R3_ASPCI|nr:hypothetical protein ASPCAL10549 [Aspergillus calidoustus]